jgi:hypothetical protein
MSSFLVGQRVAKHSEEPRLTTSRAGWYRGGSRCARGVIYKDLREFIEQVDALHALRRARDPRIPPEAKLAGITAHSKLIIEACRPFPWADKFPPTSGSHRKKLGRSRRSGAPC